MGHADVDSIVTLMDPVCGGDHAEIAAIRHLLATTTCEDCGSAAYDAIRLSNAFPGSLIDAWHLYREVAPRIEAGELELDIDPAHFARIAILCCPTLMKRQPSLVAPVARAAIREAQRHDVDPWTRLEVSILAHTWIARALRSSGRYERAFSLARRGTGQLKGRSAAIEGAVCSTYAMCLHDLGRPRRAWLWSQRARDAFHTAGLYLDSAAELFLQASISWEFRRDGQGAESAIRQCLRELPAWDRFNRKVANLSLMRYQAEQGTLTELTGLEPFENPRHELRRLWTYAKAYRALGLHDMAHQAYADSLAMLSDADAFRIEIELDRCGLLLAEGRITEVCNIAEQAISKIESRKDRDYYAPMLSLLRKVITRRLFTEDVLRYVQRRAAWLSRWE